MMEDNNANGVGTGITVMVMVYEMMVILYGTTTVSSGLTTFANNDIIGVGFDLDNKNFIFLTTKFNTF